jgi:hypothetical protein
MAQPLDDPLTAKQANDQGNKHLAVKADKVERSASTNPAKANPALR